MRIAVCSRGDSELTGQHLARRASQESTRGFAGLDVSDDSSDGIGMFLCAAVCPLTARVVLHTALLLSSRKTQLREIEIPSYMVALQKIRHV